MPAAADLYRWVDPESGSVKFSSYPPPWFGDAAKQGRAPKVEVIAPMKMAPAFEPGANADREPAESANKGSVGFADGSRNGRRDALLKQLAQRVAAVASAAPEAVGKAQAGLLEALQQLEQLDRQFKAANPKEEAARLEEKLQLAAPLETQRMAVMQQLSTLRPPSAGSAPDAIESAWRATQRQLALLEATNGAIDAIDPRKVNSRHFETRALMEKLYALWEPLVDPSQGRAVRDR